jgi:predicted acyl esterase
MVDEDGNFRQWVSSTAIDTQFIVKLTDQHPQDAASRAKGEQPAYTPVSKGWLKASHREEDQAARRRSGRSILTRTRACARRICEFDIEVLSVAYVFVQQR